MTITTPYVQLGAGGRIAQWNNSFSELYPDVRVGDEITKIFPKWNKIGAGGGHRVMADCEGDMVQIDQIDDDKLGEIFIIRRAEADLLRLDLYSDIVDSIIEFGKVLTSFPAADWTDRQYTAEQKRKIDSLMVQYQMLHHFTANIIAMSKVVKRQIPAKTPLNLAQFADRVNRYVKCRCAVITPLTFIPPMIHVVEMALFRVLIAMCWRIPAKSQIAWSSKVSGQSLIINLIAVDLAEIQTKVGSTDYAVIKLIAAEMGWVYHERNNEQILCITT
jgi:hypothetical protein